MLINILRSSHPVPTFAVTLLTLLLAIAFGVPLFQAVLVIVAVFFNQIAIGLSNDIADLTPLLNNAEFATGDSIYVNANNLDCGNQTAIINAIEARGATVHDNPCD